MLKKAGNEMAKSSTSFEKGNQANLRHGGEGAIRRVAENKEFIGLAREEQWAVEGEFQDAGQAALVRKNAMRLQTGLNLYWNAVEKAAADGDLAAFDRYIARYGWLSGVTLRAWAQVAQDEQKAARRGAGVIDVLAAMDKGAKDGD
jgi:hypothetical protein